MSGYPGHYVCQTALRLTQWLKCSPPVVSAESNNNNNSRIYISMHEIQISARNACTGTVDEYTHTMEKFGPSKRYEKGGRLVTLADHNRLVAKNSCFWPSAPTRLGQLIKLISRCVLAGYYWLRLINRTSAVYRQGHQFSTTEILQHISESTLLSKQSRAMFRLYQTLLPPGYPWLLWMVDRTETATSNEDTEKQFPFKTFLA